VRGVGEDELGAQATLRVDGSGERIRVRVAGLEAGLFARREAEDVGVGDARELGKGNAPVGRAGRDGGAGAISRRCAARRRSLSATRRAAPTMAPVSVTENLFE